MSSSGTRAKCPICSRPTEQAYRPFCSRRCADVDLSRWLRGAYAIPDEDQSEDGDESSGADGTLPAASSAKDQSGSTH